MPALITLKPTQLAPLLAFFSALGTGEVRADCDSALRVLRSGVTYQTRLFKGKPTRRDALVAVDVRSTSTVTISQVELAIFLGVSMEGVEETRPAALPTRRFREFQEGGLAFRALIEAQIPPGATRTLKVTKRALPMDKDIYAITAKIAGCKAMVPVGEATLANVRPKESGLGLIAWLAIGLGMVIIAMIIVRLFK